MPKKKVIAIFDSKGQYLNHCTFDQANRIISSNKGRFVGKRMIKLYTKKIEKIKEKRQIVFESHRMCYICNEPIPKSEQATIDHLVPRGQDEKADTKFNKKCCCYRCNHDKGNRTLSQYIEHIKKNRENYLYITNDRLKFLEDFAIKHEKEYFGLLKKYLNTEGDLL